MMNASLSRSKSKLFKLAFAISCGLGSGLSPVAPGTIGSAALVAIWYGASVLGLFHDIISQLFVTALIFILGLLCSRIVLKGLSEEEHAPRKGKIDPQFIVVDEWAGMLAALVMVDFNNPVQVLSAFLLFRVFDVLKPGPVRAAERLPGEWGIMFDDLLAGIFAAVVLQGIWVIM